MAQFLVNFKVVGYYSVIVIADDEVEAAQKATEKWYSADFNSLENIDAEIVNIDEEGE